MKKYVPLCCGNIRTMTTACLCMLLVSLSVVFARFKLGAHAKNRNSREERRYNWRMQKTRLDLLLVERGLAESRAKAQAVIMAGQVRVDGQVVDRSSATFLPAVKLEIDPGPRFVSRGGEKLQAALDAFPVSVAGLTCADVGASTGGFTDCLLQHAAGRVYAIDVGKGLLHWKLRNDARVVVMEGTNARYVVSLPDPIQLVTIDASFISLKILLPVVKEWLSSPPGTRALQGRGSGGEGEPPLRLSPNSQNPEREKEGGQVIALIKPQFEAGKKVVAVGKGVVRDADIHRRVLLDVLTYAQSQDLILRGLIRSPVLGPKGNVEFLAWLQPEAEANESIQTWIDKLLLENRPGRSLQNQ